MKSLTRKRGKGKVKVADLRNSLRQTMALGSIDDADVKIWLLQAGMPAILAQVQTMFEEEVKRIAGSPRTHGKINTRWGEQGGSIYILDQKIPVDVPRVRNKTTDTEVPLAAYQALRQPREANTRAYRQVLNGISTHKYKEAASLLPETFGMSASCASKRFIAQSSQALSALQNRDLSVYDFTALFIDGKRFADDGIMIAMGVTIEGKKILLGIEQTATENSQALEQFFEKLKTRGLRIDNGILCVVDGSKGLIKALERSFTGCYVLQRCQWHKIENIVSYLPKHLQALWRAKLRQAYAQHTYTDALSALQTLSQELQTLNPSAAHSLQEGMSDTLTLHYLGLNRILRKSFSTTNCMESIMSQVGQYTDRVDRWQNGEHTQRWVAAALTEIEPRLQKVRGYNYLPLLRERVRKALQRDEKQIVQEQAETVTTAGIQNG